MLRKIAPKKWLDLGPRLVHGEYMAVYTPVTEIELKDFLSAYDLGALRAFDGIEAGVSNTNYFVTTDAGRYVLTLFEPHRVKAEDIPFFIHYSSTLEQAGVPCPKTLLRRDGKSISLLCNRPAALFSVLDGAGSTAGTLTPSMCEQAGAVLAKMHLAAGNIHEVAINHFGLNRWKLWVGDLDASMDRIAPGLHDFARTELGWVSMRWPSKLPSGAIHADYFPDNVFFKDGNVSGVIDFHFVCTDLFAYDLAIALNAWSFDQDNVFQSARFAGMMRGYNSVRPLGAEEQNALPVLLRAAALRFLLSRIEEKLNWNPGDFMVPHDPMVFESRLRHFQSEKIAA